MLRSIFDEEELTISDDYNLEYKVSFTFLKNNYYIGR